MRLLLTATGLLIGSTLLSLCLQRSSNVEAGTAVRMDVGELVDHAELVIEARVVSALAFEAPGGHIETEYILDVARTFEGEDLPVRAIRLPGGILPDGRGMMLAGMPRLAVGEEALLFLSPSASNGLRMPVGLAQGKLSLITGEAGEKVLLREQAGLTLVDPDSGELSEAAGFAVLPYAEIVARIEAALAGQEAR